MGPQIEDAGLHTENLVAVEPVPCSELESGADLIINSLVTEEGDRAGLPKCSGEFVLGCTGRDQRRHVLALGPPEQVLGSCIEPVGRIPALMWTARRVGNGDSFASILPWRSRIGSNQDLRRVGGTSGRQQGL